MSIIETAKDVYDLVKKGTTIGLQEKLMEIREQALELQEENIALKKKIRDLETECEIEHDISFDGRMYWRTKPGTTAETKEGPYCQPCYDDKKKLIRLQEIQAQFVRYTGKGWQCPICEKTFPMAGHF
jgi:hypothetical protein